MANSRGSNPVEASTAIGVTLIVTAAALAIFATGGLGAFGVGALWGSVFKWR